jgi:hypothetical protein
MRRKGHRENESFQMKLLVKFTLLAIATLCPTPCPAAGGRENANPDLTKGESIPDGATHDWNLGATGARGWMYSEQFSTYRARQIAITAIAKGSPADGILKQGDVILGVAGKPFPGDARVEFGKALTLAESEEGKGRLSLLRWRDGNTGSIVIQLPVLGTYGPTAPYDCPKSERILKLGCGALAKRMLDPEYRGNAITRSLNALALLASGNEQYLPVIKREAKWAAGYHTTASQSWWYGYVITFLSEYLMATGDESVMPGLRRLAMETANGQSVVGSWGHGFADAQGRLGGYGMMNAPGLPLTISLMLARQSGVRDPAIDRAIDRSAKLVRFYAGKGAVPYGDHAPWMQTHEDNGKCSMAAVLFNLLGEPESARFFNRMSVAAHGAERDYGHSGNFWNITWALPGVAQAGPAATGAWMDVYGAWYFDLARQWDGSFRHQGPPDLKPDKTAGWDATGAFLLAYAWPLRNLALTGKGGNDKLHIDAATAKSLIEDGKGWTRHDRNGFYGSLSEAELLERLDSWSPIVRERAAIALAMNSKAPIDKLIEKLHAGRLESRLGACQAFAKLGARAAPALSELRQTLQADDMWLRVQAAEAIAAMGEAGMTALPELLEQMARNGPGDKDPRGMEQRFLSFAVFTTMLKKHSLKGVDRDLLRKAIAVSLRNEDGKARTAAASLYDRLTYDELRPLLPAIYDAIVEPAPSGIMFADGVRINGLQLLARHQDPRAPRLALDLMEINRWGKRGRVEGCIKALEMVGDAAKPLLPELRRLEKDLKAHREANTKVLMPSIERLEKLIETLEGS